MIRPKGKSSKAFLCLSCETPLEKQEIAHTQEWDGDLFRFEEVPAWVCPRCGERSLPGPVVERLFEIITHPSKPYKTLKVPVWKYDQLAAEK